tara:strand:- start:9947 stop:10141 length:195 start_codon:yes stop_codon:yes gene_type:complete
VPLDAPPADVGKDTRDAQADTVSAVRLESLLAAHTLGNVLARVGRHRVRMKVVGMYRVQVRVCR